MLMSNFKRILSALMAVLMVLGMFSCLSTVSFAGSTEGYEHQGNNWNKRYDTLQSLNPDAYTSNQNNQVLTYQQLLSLHGNESKPFVYHAVQVFEPAKEGETPAFTTRGIGWVPTDHKVQPGEQLLVRIYVKSNAYVANMDCWTFFSRSFFDLDPGGAGHKYTATKDYSHDLYPKDGLDNDGFPTAKADIFNPATGTGFFNPNGILVDTPLPSGSNYTRSYTLGRAASINASFRTASVLTALGLTQDITYAWDATRIQFGYTYPTGTDISEQVAYQFDSDEHIAEEIVNVKTNSTKKTVNGVETYVDLVPTGTVGYIGMDENYEKAIKTNAQHYLSVTADADSSIASTTYAGNSCNIYTADANHIFTIASDSSTPSTGNSVKFFDGTTELTNLEMTGQTGTVDISNVSYSKTGLTFGGWSATPGGTTPVTSVDASSGDVSVYAIWNAVATFTADGAPFDTQTVAEGGNFTAPSPAPSKQGYSFLGWYDAADANETIVTFPVTASANKNYVAKFAQIYTISFIDRGDVVGTQSGVEGTAIEFPAAASLDPNPGYTLTGWTPADTTINATTSSYTAVWSAGTYAVVYDSDGGSAVADGAFEFGATITAPTAPTKDGYNFASWAYYEDSSYSVPYAGTTMPAQTLYAKASWTAINYPVRFTINGVEDTSLATSADFGTAITMPTITEEDGYQYSNWLPEDGYTMDQVGGKTYNMTKTAKAYTATFVSQGATIDVQTVVYGNPVSFPTNYTVPAGMRFTGWNRENADGSYTFIASGSSDTMPAANTTYTTVFEGTPHTLTKIINGVTTTETVNYGAVIDTTLPAAPEGYSWGDWTGIPADGKMPDADLTITVDPVINQYTITIYDGNTDTVLDTITQNYNTAVTAPDYQSRKEGYSFTGWQETFPTTMPAADTAIHALFTINDYKIKFIYGDGENDFIEQSFTYGTAPTAPDVSTMKEGYTFVEWQPALPPIMPASNLQTTAQWTINSYKLNYMVRDLATGSFVRFVPQEEVEYNTALSIIGVKTQNGWTYSAWSTDPDTEAAPPANMPAGDLTLYSTGTKNVYTDIWYDLDGTTVVKTAQVEYQADIPHPELPAHAGCDDPYWTPRMTKQPANDQVFNYAYQAGSVNYSVIYRVQQLDGTFVNEDPITMSANMNTTVNATTTMKQRPGFTCDENASTLSLFIDRAGLEMVIVFNRNQYTMTVVDGAGTNSTTYYYGAAISEPVPTVPAGKTFKSWKYVKNTNNSTLNWATDINDVMPNFNFTATATYNDNTYTLTPYVDWLDGNGFTALNSVPYGYGDTIAAVADQSKTGYTFTGWCTDATLATPYVFGSAIEDDVEIYASFVIKQSTVTFVNGITSETIGTATGDYGTAVTFPDAPTVTGYNFLAWDQDPASFTFPEADVTVTANYSKGSYVLTYDVDGQLITRTYQYGATITPIADPTKTGYEFTGWDPAVPQTMPGENYTVTAQFSAKDFEAKFMATDKDTIPYETKSVTFGQDITAPETDPYRSAQYTFKGWKLAGTSDSALVTFPYQMNAEGITFIGVWEQDTSNKAVQKVTRVTTPYYQLGEANYNVEINVEAFKLHVTDGTTTWTFSKATFRNHGVGSSGINSITPDGKGGEIWNISLALPAGENAYQAYITNMDYITETAEQYCDFSVEYNVRDAATIADECEFDITGFMANSQKVVRGDQVTWTLTTSDKVTWIKFNYGYTSAKDGVTKNFNVLYKKNATQTDSFTVVDSGNGKLTWTIKSTLTFSTSDARVTQDWKLYYKTGATSDYIPVNEENPVQIVVCRDENAAVDTAAGYDKYSIIEASSAAQSVKKGTRSEVVILTTDDCDKVRITINGKSATFQATSANTVVETDANTHIKTWTINFKYSQPAGTYTVDCAARGPAWGDAESFDIVITA